MTPLPARCAMDLSFGTRLRLQREQQQVSLAAIAEQTKIRASLLEGLERDDVSHWPMGVFRRSYFRAYAEAIGLKSDAFLQEFLEPYPDPADGVPAVVAAARLTGGESPGRRPPTRLRFLIGSAMRALPALRHQPRETGTPLAQRVQPGAVDSAAGKPARVEREFSLITPPRAVVPEPAVAADDERLSMEFDDGSVTLPSAEAVDRSVRVERTPAGVELSDVAHLCTRLARATDPRDLSPVLEDAARLVDAVGLVLWMWDPRGSVLLPVLSHGYSDEVLAELRCVLL